LQQITELGAAHMVIGSGNGVIAVDWSEDVAGGTAISITGRVPEWRNQWVCKPAVNAIEVFAERK